MNNKVTGIILCAGNSERFNQGKNKNLFLVNNKPIFMHSLDVFLKNNLIDDIIITIKEEEKRILSNYLMTFDIKKPIKFVIGGNSRKKSVFNSISETDSDIVIIQDGARPKIKDDYINNCLVEMNKYAGVSIAVKAKDTIKITNDDGEVIETTNRSNTWLIQTPQCFYRNILLKCHLDTLDDDNFTDDCMLLEKYGYKVKLIKGDYTNIKVTTFDDMELIKKR